MLLAHACAAGMDKRARCVVVPPAAAAAPSGTAIMETGEQRPCPITGEQEKEPCSWCDLTSALKGRQQSSTGYIAGSAGRRIQRARKHACVRDAISRCQAPANSTRFEAPVN
jgi:hypothetical protein